jgi:hypothetical protein
LIPVFGIGIVREAAKNGGTGRQPVNRKNLHVDARERAAGESPRSMVNSQWSSVKSKPSAKFLPPMTND